MSKRGDKECISDIKEMGYRLVGNKRQVTRTQKQN